MDGRILAGLIVVLVGLAATDERSHLHAWLTTVPAAETGPEPADKAEVAVVRSETSRGRQSGRTELVRCSFAAADLVASSHEDQAPFANPLELGEFLRQVTGKRNWLRDEKLAWLDRQRMLQVTQTPEILDEIRDHLQRMRGVGRCRVRLTLRLRILPSDATDGPRAGSTALISDQERSRLEERWAGRTDANRDLTRAHSLRDGDVVYAWTATRMENQDSYRGANFVARVSDDDQAVTLTPHPYLGDSERVRWPELALRAGSTAVYDLPAPVDDSGVKDPTRVLLFVTVDSVTAG